MGPLPTLGLAAKFALEVLPHERVRIQGGGDDAQ